MNDTPVPPLALAIASAAIVAFLTTATGKVGGYLLLVVAIGLLLVAATGRLNGAR